jgi:hypothetical protein
MPYIPRNPWTPKEEEVFTPTHFLQRSLDFRNWDRQNPVVHQPTCRQVGHSHQAANWGMCCLDHLKQCIEGEYLNLAQCRTGLAVEPDGYRKYLHLAEKRLAELEAGVDDIDKWNNLLEKDEDDVLAWIWVDGRNHETQPGFSLHAYKIACLKVGYTPDFKYMSQAFYDTPEELEKYWAETE